jgi:oligoribonuclease (3'-5' exoribonuclease)
MVQNNIILWIDLETTGSSDDAEIIEFGGILTDATPNLNTLGEYTATNYSIQPYEAPVVTEMHEKSGLTEALKNPDHLGVSSLEKDVLRWINDTVGFSTEHIAWGGSGVGHFDSRYIKKYMPYLNKRLTYWVYDVGVMRRMFRLAEIDTEEFLPQETKTHRAIDDVRFHVTEARFYTQLLYRLKNISILT